MADVKISELTALASASADVAGDVLAIVDTSVPQTKKITVENLVAPITLDKSNLKVGIGETSPQSNLHISDTASTGVMLSDTNAGSNVKNYQMYSDSGLLGFRRLTDAYSGYSPTMVIKESNVGIGTDSPDNNMHIASTSSETGMIIQSNLGGTGSAIGGQIKLALGARNNSGSGQADTQSGDILGQIMFEGQGTDYSYQGGNIKTVVTTGDGNDNRSNQETAMVFETILTGSASPAERFRIGENGFVGINRDTDIHERLTVGGMICSMASSATSSTAGNQRAILDLTSNGARVGHFRGSNGAGSGSCSFFVDSLSKMHIDSSGNVGVGTTAPGAMLDIANTANNDFPLKIRGNIDNDGGFTGIKFGYEADTGNYEKCAIKVEGTSGNVNPDFHILLNSAADSSDVSTDNTDSRLMLANDGDVHWNGKLSNPSANNGAFGGMTFLPNSVDRFMPLLGSSSDSNNIDLIRFFAPAGSGSDVGSISTSGNQTNFETSSDYRLKENEAPLANGLTKLNQLKPYNFNWKIKPDEVVDGFFAHEVQEIVPFAVSGEKDRMETLKYEEADDIPKGKEIGDEYEVVHAQKLDHSKLVPLLVKAVQELSAKVEALENA
mgnify:CR=1 FL=1